jgi:hypothetical protein
LVAAYQDQRKIIVMMTNVKVLVLGGLLVSATSLVAGVVPVGVADFAPGSPVITFDGNSGSADGVTVGGVTFHYADLVFDGGPGVTNNVAPTNLTSTGAADGVLTMGLSSRADTFAFGWAVLAVGPIPDALEISVFNGPTLLGSLSYGGDADPVFTGGFAGIRSSEPFDRVTVTFAPSGAPAFALDNIIQSNAVPEPATLFLVSAAGILIALRRNKSR